MSCQACIKAQHVAYAELAGATLYQWKNARIAIVGCKQHVKEMIEFLDNCIKINAYKR